MRVLVTGGAGFVGGEIVRLLASRGHEVSVLDLATPDDGGSGAAGLEVAVPAVRVLRGDVRDAGAVERALEGVDAVCHQAAKVGLGVGTADMPAYVGCNDLGTAVLLAGTAAAGVRSLVLAGSMVVYGEGRAVCGRDGVQAVPPRREEDLRAGRFEPLCLRCGDALQPGLVPEDAVPDPRNTYAVTKLAQEQLARVWARETGGSVTVLRYHNVYGPGMPRDTPYAGVAAIFRSALERGVAPRVFEDGGQRRDFVSVRDVAAANLAALEQPGDQGVRTYNVGSGRVRTVLDVAVALSRTLGGPEPLVTGEYRLGDVRHVTADTSRIRAELAWRPRVGFEEGMAELAAPSRREQQG